MKITNILIKSIMYIAAVEIRKEMHYANKLSIKIANKKFIHFIIFGV